MSANEDQVGVPRPRTRSRRRWLFIGLASGLLLLCGVGAGTSGPISRHASPYAALDAYTAAATTGDRRALGSIIGDSQQRKGLIDRHADKPMAPTSVSMGTTVSAVWWTR